VVSGLRTALPDGCTVQVPALLSWTCKKIWPDLWLNQSMAWCLQCDVSASSSVKHAVREVNVRPAIIVVITDCHAKSPTLVGNTGLVSNVGKSAVVVIVQKMARGEDSSLAVPRSSNRSAGRCRASHRVVVEPAIVS
jgi:hypothetical protein